jgi:hypothetical protein
MPFNYDGIPTNITTESPLAVTAASNTNPITITVSGSLPAEFFSGATPLVDISGVQGNTAANGQYPATVTGASTFTIPQAGSGAYTTGGSVQPLYLKSFYAIPSDGDNDNSASISPSLETLGDRTQWLASRTGAYKMVTSLIINSINDPTVVAYWATAAVAATLTDTGFGGTTFDPGHPFVIPQLISGDLVRLSFTATTSNNWPSLAQLSLFQAFLGPGQTTIGGGIGAYTKITGSGLGIALLNSAFSLRCQFISGGMGNYGILPSLRVPATTGSYQLWGDSMCIAEVWRPTGMPQ